MTANRQWFKSIYTKLFVALFAIILPLLATQLAMYHWGRTAVTKELNSAASSNVIYLRDNFTANIKSINSQLEYLLADYTITSFFINHNFYSTPDYYITMSEVMNLLKLIRNSNPYMEEIALYYPTMHLKISSKGRVYDVAQADFERIIADFRNQQSLMMESFGQISVGRMSPSTSYFGDRMPKYFVQAVLSEAAVQTHLSSFSQYSNKNALMLNHNTGNILSGTESILIDSAQKATLFNLVKPLRSEGVYSFSVKLNTQPYIAVACYAKAINCSFVQLIPAETLQTIPNRFVFFIFLFGVLSVLVIVIFSFIMYRLVKRPMNDLVGAFSTAGSGDFDKRLDTNYSSYEYNRLAEHFNNMTTRIKDLISANYEQTIRLQHAELKQLQSQINPHFLYNSFFFLRHMINRKGNEQARAFASYLGKYFQYITKNGTDMVPLNLEYEHAVNYLSIQLMRFENRFLSDIEELPGDCREISVPRLILQPIFENVLEHGMKNNSGEGMIKLRFSREGTGLLHIVVEDNGNCLSDDVLDTLRRNLEADTPITETTGIINIHRRLQLHFGKECGLSVARSELGGLCVDVSIQMSNEREGRA